MSDECKSAERQRPFEYNKKTLKHAKEMKMRKQMTGLQNKIWEK